MKTAKYTIALAILFLGLASCNKEETNTYDSREQVNLSAGVVTTVVADAETRATGSPSVSAFTNRTFKLIVKDNRTSSAFADITQTVKTGTDLTGSNIEVDGVTDVNPAKVALEAPLYWDDLGGVNADLKLIGVYPSTFTGEEFTVGTQITTAEGTDNANDLMLAYHNNYLFINRATAANLPFEHKMAKVTLNIIGSADGPVDLNEIKNVTLNGVNIKATVDIATGTVTATDEKSNVTPFKEEALNEEGHVTYSAIVAPTTGITSETQIATITTTQGNTYNVKVSKECSLEAGKNNIFNITLSKSGVNVSATIKSWENNTLADEEVKLVDVEVAPIEGTDITEGTTLTLKFIDAESKEHTITYTASPKEAGGELYWKISTPLYWDDIKFNGEESLNVDAILKIKNDTQTAEEEKLYASETTISKATMGTITFTEMTHPLSKLVITVNTTSDGEKVDLTKITEIVLPQYPYSAYDMNTIPVSGTNTKGDIVVAKPTSASTHSYTLYIFPQTITQSDKKDVSLLNITTTDNTLVNTYKLITATQIFAPNNTYNITVTLKKSAIAVGSTVTVSPWVEGADITGDGTITQ